MLFFFLSLFFLVFNDLSVTFILYVSLLLYLNNCFFSNKITVLYKTTSLEHFSFIFYSLVIFFQKLLVSLFTFFLNTSFTLKWKPLFKRSSYYGIYRSSRNQWLNK